MTSPHEISNRNDDSTDASAESPVSSPLAVQFYASLLETDSLVAGAQRLAALLVSHGDFDRAAIGLRDDDEIQLIAGSHLDPGQLPSDYAQLLQGAMEEAIDQGHTVFWPYETGDTAPILVEQRSLQIHVGGTVATIPLGVRGEALAAVCIERHDGRRFTESELRAIEEHLVLAIPALRWIRRAEEPGYSRTWRNLRRHWAALRQPKKRGKRRILVMAALAVAFAALVPLDDHVSGRARIEGAEQRLIAAPTDGFIKTAHVRPGDNIRAGGALVDLIEADLLLERERWMHQLAQYENAHAAAMSDHERVAAATSMARIEEAQAEITLIEGQLKRGRITAPFDALVISGDLSQSIGAPVRQGDTLMTLASSGRQRVIVEIDEVDIARILPGQAGQLALSSLPWSHDDLIVERIAPLAKAVDGRNIFEVEARLLTPRDDLRPGLMGRAKLVAGRTPLLVGWLRGALLRLRVLTWAWLG